MKTLIKLSAVSICILLTLHSSHSSSPSKSFSSPSITSSEQKTPQVQHDVYDDETLTESQKWELIADFYNEYAWPYRHHLINYTRSALKESKLSFSSGCRKALKLYAQGLEDEASWAYEIMDATAKTKSGFLSGDYVDFGKWDQCMESVYQDQENNVKFTGKYCLSKWFLPLPETKEEFEKIRKEYAGTWMLELYEILQDAVKFLPITNGICFPSLCSGQEINQMIQFYLDQEEIPLRVVFEDHCDVPEDFNKSYTSYPWWKQMCGYILMTIVSLVFISTIISSYYPDSMNSFWSIWDATNSHQKLFYQVESEDGKKLGFICGLRFLYLAIAVWAHVVFSSGITTPETHVGLIQFQGPENPILSGLVQMAGLLISWNVVVGALLSFYVWNPEIIEKKGRLSFIKFFVGRVLRTTPIIGATVMMILGWSPSWSSGGPIFMKGFKKLQENCINHGWKEIFYYSNQVKADEICLLHGWYMGADLHLYTLSFFVMLAFYKKPKVGFAMCGLMVILAMILQGFAAWYYNTGMTFAFTTINIHNSIQEAHLLHFATINYLSSYAIGLILGYVIVNKIHVSREKYWMGWILSSSIMISAIYWHNFLFNSEDASRTQIIFAASTLRTCVALVGAWLIYAMWIGIPYVTAFYSQKIFLLLARINYSTFMFHFLLLWFNNFTLRNTIEFRPLPLIMRWNAEMILSHFLGYLAYLIFEAPFNNLIKAVIGSKRSGDVTNKRHPVKDSSDFNANVNMKSSLNGSSSTNNNRKKDE